MRARVEGRNDPRLHRYNAAEQNTIINQVHGCYRVLLFNGTAPASSSENWITFKQNNYCSIAIIINFIARANNEIPPP